VRERRPKRLRERPTRHRRKESHAPATHPAPDRHPRAGDGRDLIAAASPRAQARTGSAPAPRDDDRLRRDHRRRPVRGQRRGHAPGRAGRCRLLRSRRDHRDADDADARRDGRRAADDRLVRGVRARRVGQLAGFTTGWLYWYFWVIVLAVEAVAGATIIQGWLPGVPIWVSSLALMTILTATNLYSVQREHRLHPPRVQLPSGGLGRVGSLYVDGGYARLQEAAAVQRQRDRTAGGRRDPLHRARSGRGRAADVDLPERGRRDHGRAEAGAWDDRTSTRPARTSARRSPTWTCSTPRPTTSSPCRSTAAARGTSPPRPPSGRFRRCAPARSGCGAPPTWPGAGWPCRAWGWSRPRP
jgi:hypothetical protein